MNFRTTNLISLFEPLHEVYNEKNYSKLLNFLLKNRYDLNIESSNGKLHFYLYSGYAESNDLVMGLFDVVNDYLESEEHCFEE